MEEVLVAPKSYEQWLKTFAILSSTAVREQDIIVLQNGVCPGIEKVSYEFQKRMQETTKSMLTRITRKCTSSINNSLQEGDFENIDVLIRRFYSEMKGCRFYLYINFLPREFIQELDRQVTREIDRYWNELKKYLETLADETNDARLYDMIYYLKRIK